MTLTDAMRRWLPLGLLALAVMSAGAGDARELRAALPGRVEAHAVCDFVAARGPAIRTQLIRDGVLDANNDGVPDAVSVGMGEGTMRGEVLEFRPRRAPKGSAAVEVVPDGFQGADYLPFGGRWLQRGGRVYTLNFESEDLRHVSYLGFIDPRNVEHLVCDFANTERESLRAVGGKDVDGVCGAVAQGQVSYAAVVEEQDPDPGLAPDRRETHVVGRVTVDVLNTGAPASLALLSYESGAGRGCTFSYFDAIVDRRIASAGDAHALLMKMQAVEPAQGRTSSRCDSTMPRWFAYRGVTYLDIATPRDALGVDPFHEVKRGRGGQIETLCKGDFMVRWRVKSMGRDFQ